MTGKSYLFGILVCHSMSPLADGRAEEIVPEVRKKHPCFMLMPQCPSGQQRVNTPWAKGSHSNTPISQPMQPVDGVFAQRRLETRPDGRAGQASALFTEDFNREARLIGRNRQAGSFLPVKHAQDIPGWTKQGADMPAHFTEQYPGNWVFMLVASKPDENVFTQQEGFKANDKGRLYTVSFDAGAGVYALPSQATVEGDQIALELLRPDGTVLKEHRVAPGKWSGRLALQNHTFTYQGDGSGPLRFRISPVYTSGVRFYGVMDHLQVFSSAADARAALLQRQTVETPAREQMIKATEKQRQEGLYPSPTPKFTFSKTLTEQLAELKTNELMLRFAASRKRRAADLYRPAYHYVNPESSMNDPNALVFWQERWHLFFIAMPPDEFPSPADILKRWHRTSIGHAVSDDLVHWQDLPYAIHPGIEGACYSGGMLAEEDRVVAFYPGIGAGQMVAFFLGTTTKRTTDSSLTNTAGSTTEPSLRVASTRRAWWQTAKAVFATSSTSTMANTAMIGIR